jgi:hypothetical protein
MLKINLIFLIFSEMTSTSPHEYGRLLFYSHDGSCSQDPNKGFKVISRLGTKECDGKYLFQVPEDKASLSLNHSMFTFKLEMPDNFVPDNDVHAKMVKKLEFKILDNRIFSSFDSAEYTFLNQFINTMNVSPLAQECELFPSGRFDSSEPDADELDEILIRNGKTLKENRQQYAKKIWKRSAQPTSLVVNELPKHYEVLTHQYEIRAPIIHGLARQPRVFPPGSRVQLEVNLHECGWALMKTEEWQTVRIDKAVAERMTYSIPTQFKTEWEDVAHDSEGACDCTKAHYDIEHYKDLEQSYEKDVTKYADVHKTYAKGNTDEPWKPHTLKKKKLVYTISTEDASKVEIKMKSELQANELMNPLEYSLESVYCNPGKYERPLSSGTKGEGVIPFFYPEMTRKSLTGNLQTYELELSQGLLPKAIIFTGMAHSRSLESNFDHCITRTSMLNANFKIKSFTILLDGLPYLRTPWKSATQHYNNFLQHIGRYENKAVALGQDFFIFRDKKWMVPMFFDDRPGNTGIVKVIIEFEDTLQETWDACFMVIPREELILDANNNSK